MEQRIEEVVAKGSSGNALYKPRAEGGGINKSVHRYNEE
jgi:hypothetical protein